MTTVRLAMITAAAAHSTLVRVDNFDALVSFEYLPIFESKSLQLSMLKHNTLALDSGAFTAWTKGKQVDIEKFIEACQNLMATHSRLEDIFALDVIGDWQASAHNAEVMWKRGIPVVPTFHVGEPWEALTAMMDAYPKIAFGGLVGLPLDRKVKWVEQAWARVGRPFPVHILGVTDMRILEAFPFHSCDSSSWELMPRSYGRWFDYGRMYGVRGAETPMDVHVRRYQRMAQKLKFRWRNYLPQMRTQIDNGRRACLAGASNVPPSAHRAKGTKGKK